MRRKERSCKDVSLEKGVPLHNLRKNTMHSPSRGPVWDSKLEFAGVAQRHTETDYQGWSMEAVWETFIFRVEWVPSSLVKNKTKS